MRNNYRNYSRDEGPDPSDLYKAWRDDGPRELSAAERAEEAAELAYENAEQAKADAAHAAWMNRHEFVPQWGVWVKR